MEDVFAARILSVTRSALIVKLCNGPGVLFVEQRKAKKSNFLLSFFSFKQLYTPIIATVEKESML